MIRTLIGNGIRARAMSGELCRHAGWGRSFLGNCIDSLAFQGVAGSGWLLAGNRMWRRRRFFCF